MIVLSALRRTQAGFGDDAQRSCTSIPEFLVTRGESQTIPQDVFASAGNLTASRAGHTATLLTNADLLMAGGYACGGIGLYGGASALAGELVSTYAGN